MKNTLKTNFHTHTYLCKHAKGTVSDYVSKAIEYGYTEIGISDHMPFEDLGYRMDQSDIKTYDDMIEAAKQEFGAKIVIKSALECEYINSINNRYEEYLDKYDYLLLGQHITYKGKYNGDFKDSFSLKSVDDLFMYKDNIVEALKTGFFKILAHPDVFMYGLKTWNEEIATLSREIIDCAIQNNVLLELNANGYNRDQVEIDGVVTSLYPYNEFWKLVAQTDAKVIINADCHEPELLKGQHISKAIELSEKLKLNIVHNI